MTNIYKYLVF